MQKSFRSRIFHSLMTVMLLCGAIAVAQAAIPPLHVLAAASNPSLGTAASFSVLGATTVTNTGPAMLSGDLGVSPGSSCTGFPSPCTGGPGTVIGTTHAADAVAAQAQVDATSAYAVAIAQACTTTFPPITDIGGMTLTSGVYCFPSSAGVTGTLTLDAQGDPNAVFIFKIGSTLITASASKVVLINGAQPSHVFWQVGSSATLGTTTNFAGSIVALTSITATTAATSICGLYALNGAVTLDSNIIHTCSPHVLAAASSPSLGTAASFAVLGATTVTNTGPAMLSGDLGVSPGSSCTGFPSPCTGGPGTVIGTTHAADAVAAQAQVDATSAYAVAVAQACTTTFPPITDIGGMTLTSGVYCFPSSAGVTGTLTLDAQGDPNAVFIFKIGSTLITASASKVVLINGAQPSHVFWQVGSSATLGTTTNFAGSIVALTSITATTAATSSCGLYALNGAVTLDSNIIHTCSPSVPPSTVKFFIQKLDSCRQAIGGATFHLAGNGLSKTKTGAKGGPTTVIGSGNCPIQHGNCVQVSTGCVSFDIPIPSSGTKTYTITETVASAGYMPCQAKNCSVITLTVHASGKITATTYNSNTRTTYPRGQSSFAGTKVDPALVYDFKCAYMARISNRGDA